LSELLHLIEETEIARREFIAAVRGLTPEQAAFTSGPDSWCIVEITEHITRAEQSGIMGMWKALAGYHQGKPVWEGENVNAGFSIEEVVRRTWKEKEIVPEIAKPQWGGPIELWIANLQANAQVLKTLGENFKGLDLNEIIYPHPISGPLTIRQRFEFLRFHLHRHWRQVENVKRHLLFPSH
jgi:hypothetical protein